MDIQKRRYANKDAFRILVASTPKTGNVWVKNLLAETYGLPLIEGLPNDLDIGFLEGLGHRWVAHQHYPPASRLLDWAKENNVLLVTTVRHPLDTLVSLFHYARNVTRNGLGVDPEMVELSRDGESLGVHSYAMLRTTFSAH